MNRIENRTYVISPELKEKDNKSFWVGAFSVVILISVAAYINGSSDFKMYAVTTLVLLVLFYFQSIKSRRSAELQGWLKVCLVDSKLQIRQQESLLWSKDILQLKSAEVEEKKYLFFSSKALLLKCKDGDSYYLDIPRPYSEKEPVELIASTITERIKGNIH